MQDIKDGKVIDKEKNVLTAEEMQKRLADIPGNEFLNYSREDLKLIFTEDVGNGEFSVNFYGNDSAYRAIGAGDLLDSSVSYAEIDGVIGKRTITEKGKTGYVSPNGDYLEIDTGSKVKQLDSISPEQQELFESIKTYSAEQETEANEKFKERFSKTEETIKNLEKYAGANFETYIKEGLGFSDFQMDKTPA